MSEHHPPHRIRLRGPWVVCPGHAGAPAGRMTVPGSLRDGGWAGFTGPVTLQRPFGRPTNLNANQPVWLVFERVKGPAEVRLNGESLGSVDGAGRFEVSQRLSARNELEVEVHATDDRCGIVGDVVLEIGPG